MEGELWEVTTKRKPQTTKFRKGFILQIGVPD